MSVQESKKDNSPVDLVSEEESSTRSSNTTDILGEQNKNTSSSDKVNIKKKPERKRTKETNETLQNLYVTKDYETACKTIETKVLSTADRGVKEQTLFINDVFDYIWGEKKDTNVLVPLFSILCEKKIISPIGMGKGFTEVVKKLDDVHSTDIAFDLGKAIGNLKNYFRDIKIIKSEVGRLKKEFGVYIIGGIYEAIHSKQVEVKLGFGDDLLKEYLEIKSNSKSSKNDNTESTLVSLDIESKSEEKEPKTLPNTKLEDKSTETVSKSYGKSKKPCRRGVTCTYPNCSFGHPSGYIPPQSYSNTNYYTTPQSNYYSFDNNQIPYDSNYYDESPFYQEFAGCKCCTGYIYSCSNISGMCDNLGYCLCAHNTFSELEDIEEDDYNFVNDSIEALEREADLQFAPSGFWHPESRDCECCKGFKYGCKSTQCKNEKQCLQCS